MASKNIKISIATALDAVGINAARRALSSLANHTREFAAGVGRNLMNVKAGFDLIVAGARKFYDFLAAGMNYERLTVTFKSLTGSMELASMHMRDLQDLGRTPPFSLEQFAAASREMMKMTDGMIGFKDTLELVGDISAATGNDLAQVGRVVGLAYQIIRDGQPFGRAGSQLFQLGILTKKQVAEFDALTESGASNVEIWDKFVDTLSRYKGAMAETEKTTQGMVEAIQGEATVAMTEFSRAIGDAAKPALEGLLGYLRRIGEDGTIELWAEKSAEALTKFADGARTVLGPLLEGLNDIRKRIMADVNSFAQGVGGAVGTIMGGGGLGDAWQAYKNEAYSAQNDVYDFDGRQAQSDREKREKAVAERSRKRAEQEAKATEQAKARFAADMQKAQLDKERKAAEERAKAEAEAAKKLAEEKKKAEEKALAERKRMEEKHLADVAKREIEAERRRHDVRIRNIEREEAETQRMIDRLIARGADDPMSRGGGGGWQADDARAERQAQINERRIEAEKSKLEARARRQFGDFWQSALDDPKNVKKLGRLSNIQQAALENMQLGWGRDKMNDLENQKQKSLDDMSKSVDDINKRLQKLGL